MSREDCFEKLEQLVLDENRIVTYKVLSRELKIHVNEAKQYLLDFFNTQKSMEQIHLQATYFLAGLQEKDGVKSLKVFVVSQNSLEKAKKKFAEVTSCHIYSVSKGIADECALYRADRLYNEKSREYSKYSVIKHPNIEIKPPVLSKAKVVKNDTKPLLKNQQVSALKNGVSSRQINNKDNFFKSNATKEPVEIEKPETCASTEVKKSNSEGKPQKPSTLASLWKKSEEKSKNENSKPEGKGKAKSPQETKKAPPKNNIMSMFSKQAEKNAGSNSKKVQIDDPIPIKKVEVEKPTKKMETAAVSLKSEKISSERKPSKPSNKRKTTQKQPKTSTKQLSESDSDECKPKKKKHRRITTFDDSDSESECEESKDRAQRSLLLPEDPVESEVQVVPPTPISDDEDPIPPTPPVLLQRGKKKICKTVKKTFMDEDGFLVTKEEKEIVSESESDEDPIASKSSTSKETLKTNQFSYRKQASLTSFFKQS